MTWRALLASVKPPPPPEKAASPAEVAPVTSNGNSDTQEAAPATAVPVPVPDATPVVTTTTRKRSSSTKKRDDSVFQLPASPLSHVVKKQETTTTTTKTEEEDTPQSPPNDPHREEAHWEPPNSGFLQHQNPNAWFIDESKPIATSPVKISKTKFTFPDKEDVVDQPKARLLFAQDFKEGIAKLEQERKKLETTDGSSHTEELGNDNFQVFVRKRPNDAFSDDFDIIRMTEDASCVVVYQTEIQHDLRKKQVRPILFGPFANCYDDCSGNSSQDVYQRAVKGLVETAKGGGLATLLLFGQSGSGKSYTMSAVEGMTARDVFT